MVDPSAGTQIYDYVQDGDGSSVITHTNPNGKVKTRRDKHGRITLVERPGEYDTAYTYDAYGLLVAEQSTNGTGKEYTYDGLDRVATVKETIPDGKWLRRTYSYGAAGVLNSIQYASQSGQITTESYSYSNGHNTGVTLPDGTAVWRLVSENDLGMATSITSGGITREYGFTAFGMPAYRRMDGGDLQDFTYSFDVATGNLLSRADGVNAQTETFSYDGLNRLVAIGSRQIRYDSRGNILSMDGIGSMTYGNTVRPYQITMLTPEGDGLVPDRQQSVSYTCYSRPSVLTEGGRSAAFTYNGDGDRVKMYVADGAARVLSRYYIGGRYEYDQTVSGSEERLYLGGDAYSAPMVYRRENGGNWTAYNIGRDCLGNVTQIATLDGTPVAEYSYDPWGRLRDPETLEIYTAGNEPELFLGRGFTGHEHLAWFGLVNMNARLYDPLLGRFLSPDPYVQAPDFSQNFNRYSYALNNPLKYSDESGEFWLYVIGAAIGGITNWIANGCEFTWDGLKYFGAGAAIGALSWGASAFTASAFSACGVAAGVLMGSATGAATGAATGFLSNGLNNMIAGRNFMHDAWAATRSGMISGAVSGAVSGGITGGKNALESGKNVWWGSEVKYGRTQWSINPSEKPFATIDFDVNTVSNNINDCVPASFTEINDYYGGDMTYQDMYSKLKYKEGTGVIENVDRLKSIAKGFFSAEGIDLSQLADQNFASSLHSGNRLVSLLFEYSSNMKHMDVVRSIRYYSTKTVIKLRVGSYSLDKLVSKSFWALSIGGLRY